MERQVGISQVRECRCAGMRDFLKVGSEWIRSREELKIKGAEGIIGERESLGSWKMMGSRTKKS